MRHRIAAGIVTCAVLAVPAVSEAASYPDHAQMDAVRKYLKQRGGVVGVGVIDSRGRVRGVHDRRRFVSASVVKAMLLVAYLRRVAHQDRGLSQYERGRLRPMITVSSNDAADWAYLRVGDGRLRQLARRASMDQFSVYGWWTRAYFSARDQAKFFWRLERLTPPRFRDYAIKLLRSVVSSQSWGIPRVGAPARSLGLLQGRLARHLSRPAGPPGGVPALPRHRVLARRPDGREPVDELRDRHDRRRHAPDRAPEAGLGRSELAQEVPASCLLCSRRWLRGSRRGGGTPSYIRNHGRRRLETPPAAAVARASVRASSHDRTTAGQRRAVRPWQGDDEQR